MVSDSDESFYGDDSPGFGFSPEVDTGTMAGVNGYNCTVGEDSKRKVTISPGGSRYQNLSANRARNGGLDGMCSEHPRKRRKGGQITTPDSSHDPSYACPYFKNNPEKNSGCAGWNKRDIHRVKEHIKRSHLKPIQCPRCNVYRAGDKGQIHIHLRDGECQKARIPAPVENDVLAKAKALERRSLSWGRIYQILFPGCTESDVPSPFWQNHTEPPTAPAIKLESPPIGTYSEDALEERLHEELGGFVMYFQKQVPRIVQELFHEYQRFRKLKFEYPSSLNVGDGGVDSSYSPPEAPPSDSPAAPPSAPARNHPQDADADSERGFSRQPNTGKNNLRPDQEQTWTEKPARKSTENSARRRQGVAPPSTHRPEAQHSSVFNSSKDFSSLQHGQGDQRQIRRDRLPGKPTGDGVRKRHSTAPPLIHPPEVPQTKNIPNPNPNPDSTPRHHDQQADQRLRGEKLISKPPINETQKVHDITPPFIHRHEPQHSSDMNQNFTALPHEQDSKGPSDIETHSLSLKPQLIATDHDRNNSSPVGYEDLAETESSGSGPEPDMEYDPTLIWGLNVLDGYDWRF